MTFALELNCARLSQFASVGQLRAAADDELNTCDETDAIARPDQAYFTNLTEASILLTVNETCQKPLIIETLSGRKA